MNENRFKYPGVAEVFSHYCKPSYAGLTLEEIISIEEKQSYVKTRCISIVNNIWMIKEDSKYENYIESFRKWYEENVTQVILTDIVLFDDVNRFTGRIDLICSVNNQDTYTSITIKTSHPSKSWDLQLAAYRQLCNANALKTGPVSRNIILKLSKKGDIASEFECENIQAHWEMFNNILQGWHYFKGD